DFGVLWEGPSTLEDLQARAPGGRVPDWKALRVRATAEFQFGLGAADALLRGLISYVVSKNNGKVRNVLADGEHVLSLRAEDGLFTLKAAGARRLRAAFPSPRLRVIVEPDSVPFQRDGKNVFAGFVRDADPEIRPGDEVLVVSPEDDLCAVAQAASSKVKVRRATDFMRIAPGRFELPSRVPKTRMLDHYTTGLRRTDFS